MSCVVHILKCFHLHQHSSCLLPHFCTKAEFLVGDELAAHSVTDKWTAVIKVLFENESS